jgi:hypothetical protein
MAKTVVNRTSNRVTSTPATKNKIVLVKNTLRPIWNPEVFNLGRSSVTQNFNFFKTKQIHST